jgi:hypothetical protein
MSLRPDPGKVPVGTTSAAGYSLTAAALAAAVVAYATGDRSAQTLGTITAAAVAVLAFIVTSAGRYAQAHAKIKATTPPVPEPSDGINLAPETDTNLYRSSPSVVKYPDAVEHVEFPRVTARITPVDDEPGDHFDAHPDIPVTAPEDVPPDNVDHPRPEVGGAIA